MTSIINNARRFWIFAIFAGWSFDFLFWKQQLGINLAIFSSLCLTAGIALLCLEGVRPARNAILLLPVILFFTTMTFVRMEPLTVFVCVGAALGLTIVLVSTYVGGKWLHYGLVDYLTRTFRLYVSVFTRGMSFIQESRRLREVTGRRCCSAP